LANVLADGFSMACSNYLSERSKHNQNAISASKTSLVTFISFVLVGCIPMIPYIFAQDNPFYKSTILTGLAFISIGLIRGKITGQNKWRSAIETFLIGSTAAIIAYIVGSLFKI
jgi:VIT1/CCC1 family predicted Fe2+/Mn2+ transporter